MSKMPQMARDGKNQHGNPRPKVICVGCQNLLPQNLFSYKIKDDPSQGIRDKCKSCTSIRAEKERERRKENWKHKPSLAMLNNSKQRAKVAELEHTLTIDDIIIPDYCPVFKNVRLNYTTVDWIGTGTFQRLKRLSKIAGNDKEETWSYASIDRIDSNFEYDYNNIRIISDYANSLKSCASDNQIVRLGEFLKNNKNSMEFECGLGI